MTRPAVTNEGPEDRAETARWEAEKQADRMEPPVTDTSWLRMEPHNARPDADPAPAPRLRFRWFAVGFFTNGLVVSLLQGQWVSAAVAAAGLAVAAITMWRSRR